MVALEAAAAEVEPSSQIGCRGGAKAEQHHQRGAAGVASRRGWSSSAEPSQGAQAGRQSRRRGGGALASPRVARERTGCSVSLPSRPTPNDKMLIVTFK